MNERKCAQLIWINLRRENLSDFKFVADFIQVINFVARVYFNYPTSVYFDYPTKLYFNYPSRVHFNYPSNV